MNLFKEGFLAVKWILSILKVYLRLRPGTTLTIIAFSAMSRVTNVLAFFLPLKVILLAGSQGIGGNLGLQIAPDQKLDWILLLSIAAVASYVLTLLFEGFSGRLAEAGSAGVLQGTNKLAMVGKQRTQARSTYSKVVQIIASTAFGFVGLIALVVINSKLVAVLAVLFLLEYLFTAIVMSGWNPAYPGRFQGFIYNHLDDYLDILSSINFLTGFFLILAPFLLGQDGTILPAVLAVVVIRRTLPALEWAIRVTATLYKNRRAIDPLIFRKQRLQTMELVENQLAREIFNKSARQKFAERQLTAVRPQLGDFDVSWLDSSIAGAYTFLISCKAGQHGLEYFQQQVFADKQAHLLGNEDFLFTMVKRQELKAPAVLARFQEGTFECQICEYGPQGVLPQERYDAVLPELMADVWCFNPPKKLVATFNAAQESLPGRLTADLIERLAVAADSAAESSLIESLLMRLPELRARLVRIPLCVFNPDINQANVAEIRPGEICVMTWIHWAIEPVGAGMPEELPHSRLPDIVRRVNLNRKGLESPLGLQDIELAGACWKFEVEMNGGQYKAALKTAEHIIAGLSR
jgi:hypothetical protein